MSRELPFFERTSLGHYIDGRFVQSLGGKTFTDFAPASDEVLGEIPAGDATDVEAAVAAAQEALRGPWGKTSAGERAAMLRKFGDLIVKYQDEFARLESLDTGKPLSETLHGDIPRAASNFHFFAELTAHQECPSYVSDDGSRHVTVREPLGIVGLITPWNLPLYLATWKLAPALAQGNAVILKPAELTPLTAMALGHIANEAGLPRGVLNVVQGFGAGAAGEALVKHPDVRAISFTGETTTGVAIMQTAAPHLKKLSFELGGKGASLVFADADLEKAAQTLTRAAFRNQGQICLAGSRLIVERRVADEVVSRVLEHVKRIRLGDPLAIETTMGSLVSKDHRDKVQSYVELARKGAGTESGCEIVCGGRIPEALPRGAYFEPTVITGVAQNSPLIQEEIFGPVLTVQTFDEYEEGLAYLNGTPYGLSCSVWTRNQLTAERASRDARTGLVWLNSWFLRNLHTAFGGMKRSGVGREGGRYSMEFYSEAKTISTPGL